MRRRSPVLLTAALCGALLAGCSSTEPPGAGTPSSPEQDAGQPPLEYVALGDSFTAAPGIADADLSDGCQRSTQNYPALLGERLEASWDVTLVDRSCIGAETGDLGGRQRAGTGTIPPQLDALTRGTDLVTLSIGGNDFSLFRTLVAGCLSVVGQDPTGSPCRDTAAAYGDVIDRANARVRQRLEAAVLKIRRRAPDARVLLVGYPQLVPDDGGCRDRLPLADGDLPFARGVNKSLTDNLRGAARSADATYVDVWSASAGHDICSEDPWVNGLQAAPGGAIPFHPLAAGQAAIAELILAEVTD